MSKQSNFFNLNNKNIHQKTTGNFADMRFSGTLSRSNSNNNSISTYKNNMSF